MKHRKPANPAFKTYTMVQPSLKEYDAVNEAENAEHGDKDVEEMGGGGGGIHFP